MKQSQLINSLSDKGYALSLKEAGFVIMTRLVDQEHTGQVIFKDGEIQTLRTVDATRAVNNEEINMASYTKSYAEASSGGA